MVWKKELPNDRVALLLMNNRNVSADVNISWTEIVRKHTHTYMHRYTRSSCTHTWKRNMHIAYNIWPYTHIIPASILTYI